jgi:hypothetical protein
MQRWRGFRPPGARFLNGGRGRPPYGKNDSTSMSDQPEENLVTYRRRMPHWRLPGSIYFVTWRLLPSQAELSNDECGVIMGALKHFAGSRYELYACVVMHDHVHLLVKPLTNAVCKTSFTPGSHSLPTNCAEITAEKPQSGKRNILTASSEMRRNSWTRPNISSTIP